MPAARSPESTCNGLEIRARAACNGDSKPARMSLATASSRKPDWLPASPRVDGNGSPSAPRHGRASHGYRRPGSIHASGNAAEGIPRGNIRGGRDPLAGGTRTEMQHYPAHVTWTRRRAARVTARSGMERRGGATIFREGVLPVARRQITDWRTQQGFSRRGPDLACESHL